jgi:hypothetical protein
LKWDGKDNAGKLVNAGQYTVLVEAAREHGGLAWTVMYLSSTDSRLQLNFLPMPN